MCNLETYTAKDRRIFNGALSDDMTKEKDQTKYLEERMRKADPTARCTYFPMEGKFLVFTNTNILENPDLVGPPQELTGNMHANKQDALIEAIMLLEQQG